MKEKFKVLKINNENTKYFISNKGRILNTKTNKFIKPRLNEKGYVKVDVYLKGKKFSKRLNRLVAEHFILFKPVSKDEINHIDGNKQNNAVSNLEYVTHKENMQHAFKNNLVKMKYGDKHHSTKYPDSLVIQIKELISRGFTTKQIQNELNLTSVNYMRLISDIKRGRRK